MSLQQAVVCYSADTSVLCRRRPKLRERHRTERERGCLCCLKVNRQQGGGRGQVRRRKICLGPKIGRGDIPLTGLAVEGGKATISPMRTSPGAASEDEDYFSNSLPSFNPISLEAIATMFSTTGGIDSGRSSCLRKKGR